MVDAVFLTDFQVKLHNRLGGFHTPEYRFTPDQIAFVHVPKTGGTSLQKLLIRDPGSRFVNLTLDRPVSRFCNPMNFDYLTVMRSPVDRVWSYYQMVLRTPEFPYRHLAKKGLKVFLSKCWEGQDMACRYYTGRVEEKPTETTLDQAFASLMNFKHVLSFDRFQADVSELLNEYGIAADLIPHERESRYRAPDPDETRLIQEYNQLDAALYDRWKSAKRSRPV